MPRTLCTKYTERPVLPEELRGILATWAFMVPSSLTCEYEEEYMLFADDPMGTELVR